MATPGHRRGGHRNPLSIFIKNVCTRGSPPTILINKEVVVKATENGHYILVIAFSKYYT